MRQPWDHGSFAHEDEDEDVPDGWGEDSPPGTPVFQPNCHSDGAGLIRSSRSTDHDDTGDLLTNAAQNPTSGNQSSGSCSPCPPPLNPIVLPWRASDVVRGAGRRELPSLFTNVPDQASGNLDPKGRPPRPPAPQSNLPFSIKEGARRRRSSREPSAAVAAAVAAAASKPSAADGVRETLHLLRKKKKWAPLEETLAGLEALQKLQRHLNSPTELPTLREASELPPISSGRGICRAENPRALSAINVRRGMGDTPQAESQSSSRNSIGSLPQLQPHRRAFSAPLSSRTGIPTL